MFNGTRIDGLEKRVKELEEQMAYSQKNIGGGIWWIPVTDITLGEALRMLVAHLGLKIERQEGLTIQQVKKVKK